MGPQAAVPRALLSTGTLPVHTGPAPAPGAGQWRPGRGQGSPQTCSQHSGPTKPEAGGRSTPGAALSPGVAKRVLRLFYTTPATPVKATHVSPTPAGALRRPRENSVCAELGFFLRRHLSFKAA